MPPSLEDQVVDFYYALFDRLFSEPFRLRIDQRLKRDAVMRQVQDSAGAASQSLTRFFLNEQLSEDHVADVLSGFSALQDLLNLDAIANPNETPEKIADALMVDMPCPEVVQREGRDAVYRVALHSIVQVLMLVGPVMAGWQRLKFSITFELPRRVVNRLNQISEQLDALGRSGQAAADERYELSYRDYLLQRFHRVEAGTVRMTTNMDVDLRELFVMPRVLARPLRKKADQVELTDAAALMDLAAARRFFGGEGLGSEPREPTKKEDPAITALDQVKRYPRNVIVGAPGSGKSTFLEWLQVKLAAVEEELVMAGQQAIPVLLRVRQLDQRSLLLGAALIEKATASKDRTALMPHGWIDRQMKNGRVLLMLDGLDETDPELRDHYVLPWLLDLCQQYPRCRYLVSSRPVGYPPGVLKSLEFVECDLLDFGEPDIVEYTRHWCTAVRLARNEPEEEARREGAADGEHIVSGFKDHPYIRNLARNPLMLSAVCLVNYFEAGELPKDRALLYRLCVEGLLHHWDQRRGIHSDFALDEKLRTCREVALAMQADDRAEYETEKVKEIFTAVLRDHSRAAKLLEHIRYRTGLLLERRPGVFAFAHLTFQEYLAARAIHEGNQHGIDTERLACDHNDGRWQEVIALYCGQAPTPAVCWVIERLLSQPNTRTLSTVLAEAYLSAGPELLQDKAFRRRVLERIAMAPVGREPQPPLMRFPPDEVAPIANRLIGKIQSNDISESHRWLSRHPKRIQLKTIAKRLRKWRSMSTFQATESIHLLHAYGQDTMLIEMAADTDVGANTLPVAWVEVTRKTLPTIAEQSNVVAVLPNQEIHLIRPKEVDYTKLARQESRDKVTWGLKQLEIPKLWETTKGQHINIGVLDTGVHDDHVTLNGRVKDFVVIDPLGRRIAANPPFDGGRHGTHVCGTIAGGKTSQGVSIGVAPEANLFVAGVLIGDTTLLTLMEGISWAVEKGVDIISMSLGFSYYEPNFREVFKILIEQFGILPVVAIGNENHGNSSSPGNSPTAFSVGAIEKVQGGKVEVAFFSSGASLVFPGDEPHAMVTKPDVVAPGVQVFSCIPPEKRPDGTYEYTYMDGTSMATPHVAGVAALLMAAKPEAPVTDIMNALKDTARRYRTFPH